MRFFDDHTAQYKGELPPTRQVASKGLIASAATESLSIQHLGAEDQGVAAGKGVCYWGSQSKQPPPSSL